MNDSPARPADNKRPVTRIGNYELIDQIGGGGMGVVFKAKQVGLDRFVALKVMNTEAMPKGSEELAKQRFLNEAKAMSRLAHPNIIPIYDVGEHLGVCYFSMKLIPGGSLSDQMGRFTRKFMLLSGFIGGVALALDHAHRNGVIHRDLKPQNILVDAEQPVVTDFGLAKLPREDKELTKLGEILGTPEYMAPEQARGESKNVKAQADFFSLGVVLYRLITGQLPFSAATDHGVIRQVLEANPERPSLLNPDVDDALEFICLKCLQKDPLRRYASGAHLAADLANWWHHCSGRQSHIHAGEEIEKHNEPPSIRS